MTARGTVVGDEKRPGNRLEGSGLFFLVDPGQHAALHLGDVGGVDEVPRLGPIPSPGGGGACFAGWLPSNEWDIKEGRGKEKKNNRKLNPPAFSVIRFLDLKYFVLFPTQKSCSNGLRCSLL